LIYIYANSKSLTHEYLLNKDRSFEIKPRTTTYYFSKPLNNFGQTDINILSEIIFNSRIKLSELARKVKLPLTTIVNRKKKLEKLGIITGYSVDLREERLGLEQFIFILKLMPEIINKVKSYLEFDRYVISYSDWIGEGDLKFTINVPNMRERDIIIKNIKRIAGKNLIDMKYYRIASEAYQTDGKRLFYSLLKNTV